MPTSPCPAEGILWRLAGGEAIEPDVRGHLDDCPDCRDRLEEISTNVAASGDPTRRPAATAREPATIGKYVIVGRLGDGGQGVVYRAIHQDLRRDAVIKLAYQPAGAGGIDRTRLLAEGRMLAELRHDNLVQVYDVDIHEGRPWLAMELVRGCTLKQQAERQRYTPRQAAAVVAAVAGAVDYLHGRGIVHQDIKPQNIMIDEQGRPRLIDFGLARLRDAWSDGEDLPRGGTPGYMAPEQAGRGADRIGPAADVFGLGGVLRFLIGLKPEDAPGSPLRTRPSTADRGASAGPAIPERLARIAQKALDADPAGRPSARELTVQLDRFAAGPARRLVLAFALIFSIAAAGGWLWIRRAEGPPGLFPAPLPSGSAWAGTFFWATDPRESKHDVRLEITGRGGDKFSGLYETEAALYAFRVEGTVHGQAVQWRFPEQVRGDPRESVVKGARVEGIIKGDTMFVRFIEGADHAVMELALIK